ncbi:MAG: flagellar hook-basal body complex protein FliE [Phycisphaerae bacterium]|jgi:flagellar hook-basal body complex protein FliE
MVDPISSNPLNPAGPLTPGSASGKAAAPATEGGFANALREQLEQVSRMQVEAEEGVQNLLTGQTQNITEVFTAARKAEVAFSLLLEIRNKLTDAYQELKRIQV